jgi:hypothetical protein
LIGRPENVLFHGGGGGVGGPRGRKNSRKFAVLMPKVPPRKQFYSGLHGQAVGTTLLREGEGMRRKNLSRDNNKFFTGVGDRPKEFTEDVSYTHFFVRMFL